MSFNGYLEMDVKVNGIDVTEISPMNYKPHGAIIYYHGYTSSRSSSLFRCRILASMGYEVFAVEQMGHGSRRFEYDINSANGLETMLKVLVQTITESPSIVNYVAEKKGYNPNDIIFAGYSEGAMASAGSFIKNPIGKLVCYNGVLDYLKFIDHVTVENGYDISFGQPYKDEMRYYSPAENLSRLENRPILLIDGALDDTVPSKFNVDTVSTLKPFYKEKKYIKHIVLEKSTHDMTVKALEFTEKFLNSEWILNYGK